MEVPKITEAVKDGVIYYRVQWDSENTGDHHQADFTHKTDAELFVTAIELALGIGRLLMGFEHRVF